MEQNNDKNENKPAANFRLAGYAFIGAGTAWLVTGLYRGLAVSLLALGIIFLVQDKTTKKQ